MIVLRVRNSNEHVHTKFGPIMSRSWTKFNRLETDKLCVEIPYTVGGQVLNSRTETTPTYISDQKAFEGSKILQTYSSRLTRWVDRFDFDFEMYMHPPGRTIGIAEYLSSIHHQLMERKRQNGDAIMEHVAHSESCEIR